MRIGNQLRFIASNLLTEAADAVDDFRAGIVPEIRVEANRVLDVVEGRVDEVLATVHSAVVEVKETLLAEVN